MSDLNRDMTPEELAKLTPQERMRYQRLRMFRTPITKVPEGVSSPPAATSSQKPTPLASLQTPAKPGATPLTSSLLASPPSSEPQRPSEAQSPAEYSSVSKSHMLPLPEGSFSRLRSDSSPVPSPFTTPLSSSPTLVPATPERVPSLLPSSESAPASTLVLPAQSSAATAASARPTLPRPNIPDTSSPPASVSTASGLISFPSSRAVETPSTTPLSTPAATPVRPLPASTLRPVRHAAAPSPAPASASAGAPPLAPALAPVVTVTTPLQHRLSRLSFPSLLALYTHAIIRHTLFVTTDADIAHNTDPDRHGLSPLSSLSAAHVQYGSAVLWEQQQGYMYLPLLSRVAAAEAAKRWTRKHVPRCGEDSAETQARLSSTPTHPNTDAIVTGASTDCCGQLTTCECTGALLSARHVDMAIGEVAAVMLGYPHVSAELTSSDDDDAADDDVDVEDHLERAQPCNTVVGANPETAVAARARYTSADPGLLARHPSQLTRRARQGVLAGGAIAREALTLPYFWLHKRAENGEGGNSGESKNSDTPLSGEDAMQQEMSHIRSHLPRHLRLPDAVRLSHFTCASHHLSYNANNTTVRSKDLFQYLCRVHERLLHLYRYVASLASLQALPDIDILPLIAATNASIANSAPAAAANTSARPIAKRIDLDAVPTAPGSTVADLARVAMHLTHTPHPSSTPSSLHTAPSAFSTSSSSAPTSLPSTAAPTLMACGHPATSLDSILASRGVRVALAPVDAVQSDTAAHGTSPAPATAPAQEAVCAHCLLRAHADHVGAAAATEGATAAPTTSVSASLPHVPVTTCSLGHSLHSLYVLPSSPLSPSTTPAFTSSSASSLSYFAARICPHIAPLASAVAAAAPIPPTVELAPCDPIFAYMHAALAADAHVYIDSDHAPPADPESSSGAAPPRSSRRTLPIRALVPSLLSAVSTVYLRVVAAAGAVLLAQSSDALTAIHSSMGRQSSAKGPTAHGHANVSASVGYGMEVGMRGFVALQQKAPAYAWLLQALSVDAGPAARAGESAKHGRDGLPAEGGTGKVNATDEDAFEPRWYSGTSSGAGAGVGVDVGVETNSHPTRPSTSIFSATAPVVDIASQHSLRDAAAALARYGVVVANATHSGSVGDALVQCSAPLPYCNYYIWDVSARYPDRMHTSLTSSPAQTLSRRSLCAQTRSPSSLAALLPLLRLPRPLRRTVPPAVHALVQKHQRSFLPPQQPQQHSSIDVDALDTDLPYDRALLRLPTSVAVPRTVGERLNQAHKRNVHDGALPDALLLTASARTLLQPASKPALAHLLVSMHATRAPHAAQYGESALPVLFGAPPTATSAACGSYVAAVIAALEGMLHKVPPAHFDVDTAYAAYSYMAGHQRASTGAGANISSASSSTSASTVGSPSSSSVPVSASPADAALLSYQCVLAHTPTFSPHKGTVALSHVLYPLYSYVSLLLRHSASLLHRLATPALYERVHAASAAANSKHVLVYDPIDGDATGEYAVRSGVFFGGGYRYVSTEAKEMDVRARGQASTRVGSDALQLIAATVPSTAHATRTDGEVPTTALLSALSLNPSLIAMVLKTFPRSTPSSPFAYPTHSPVNLTCGPDASGLLGSAGLSGMPFGLSGAPLGLSGAPLPLFVLHGLAAVKPGDAVRLSTTSTPTSTLPSGAADSASPTGRPVLRLRPASTTPTSSTPSSPPTSSIASSSSAILLSNLHTFCPTLAPYPIPAPAAPPLPPAPLLPSYTSALALMRVLARTLVAPGAIVCLLTHPGFAPAAQAMALPRPAVAVRILHWFTVKRLIDVHAQAHAFIVAIGGDNAVSTTPTGDANKDKLDDKLGKSTPESPSSPVSSSRSSSLPSLPTLASLSSLPQRLSSSLKSALHKSTSLLPLSLPTSTLALARYLFPFFSSTSEKNTPEIPPYPFPLKTSASTGVHLTFSSLLSLFLAVSPYPNNALFASLSQRDMHKVLHHTQRQSLALDTYTHALAALLRHMFSLHPLAPRRVLDWLALLLSHARTHTRIHGPDPSAVPFPAVVSLARTMLTLTEDLFSTAPAPVAWTVADAARECGWEGYLAPPASTSTSTSASASSPQLWPGNIDLGYFLRADDTPTPLVAADVAVAGLQAPSAEAEERAGGASGRGGGGGISALVGSITDAMSYSLLPDDSDDDSDDSDESAEREHYTLAGDASEEEKSLGSTPLTPVFTVSSPPAPAISPALPALAYTEARAPSLAVPNISSAHLFAGLSSLTYQALRDTSYVALLHTHIQSLLSALDFFTQNRCECARQSQCVYAPAPCHSSRAAASLAHDPWMEPGTDGAYCIAAEAGYPDGVDGRDSSGHADAVRSDEALSGAIVGVFERLQRRTGASDNTQAPGAAPGAAAGTPEAAHNTVRGSVECAADSTVDAVIDAANMPAWALRSLKKCRILYDDICSSCGLLLGEGQFSATVKSLHGVQKKLEAVLRGAAQTDGVGVGGVPGSPVPKPLSVSRINPYAWTLMQLQTVVRWLFTRQVAYVAEKLNLVLVDGALPFNFLLVCDDDEEVAEEDNWLGKVERLETSETIEIPAGALPSLPISPSPSTSTSASTPTPSPATTVTLSYHTYIIPLSAVITAMSDESLQVHLLDLSKPQAPATLFQPARYGQQDLDEDVLTAAPTATTAATGEVDADTTTPALSTTVPASVAALVPADALSPASTSCSDPARGLVVSEEPRPVLFTYSAARLVEAQDLQMEIEPRFPCAVVAAYEKLTAAAQARKYRKTLTELGLLQATSPTTRATPASPAPASTAAPATGSASAVAGTSRPAPVPLPGSQYSDGPLPDAAPYALQGSRYLPFAGDNRLFLHSAGQVRQLAVWRARKLLSRADVKAFELTVKQCNAARTNQGYNANAHARTHTNTNVDLGASSRRSSTSSVTSAGAAPTSAPGTPLRPTAAADRLFSSQHSQHSRVRPVTAETFLHLYAFNRMAAREDWLPRLAATSTSASASASAPTASAISQRGGRARTSRLQNTPERPQHSMAANASGSSSGSGSAGASASFATTHAHACHAPASAFSLSTEKLAHTLEVCHIVVQAAQSAVTSYVERRPRLREALTEAEEQVQQLEERLSALRERRDSMQQRGGAGGMGMGMGMTPQQRELALVQTDLMRTEVQCGEARKAVEAIKAAQEQDDRKYGWMTAVVLQPTFVVQTIQMYNWLCGLILAAMKSSCPLCAGPAEAAGSITVTTIEDSTVTSASTSTSSANAHGAHAHMPTHSISVTSAALTSLLRSSFPCTCPHSLVGALPEKYIDDMFTWVRLLLQHRNSALATLTATDALDNILAFAVACGGAERVDVGEDAPEAVATRVFDEQMRAKMREVAAHITDKNVAASPRVEVGADAVFTESSAVAESAVSQHGVTSGSTYLIDVVGSASTSTSVSPVAASTSLRMRVSLSSLRARAAQRSNADWRADIDIAALRDALVASGYSVPPEQEGVVEWVVDMDNFERAEAGGGMSMFATPDTTAAGAANATAAVRPSIFLPAAVGNGAATLAQAIAACDPLCALLSRMHARAHTTPAPSPSSSFASSSSAASKSAPTPIIPLSPASTSTPAPIVRQPLRVLLISFLHSLLDPQARMQRHPRTAPQPLPLPAAIVLVNRRVGAEVLGELQNTVNGLGAEINLRKQRVQQAYEQLGRYDPAFEPAVAPAQPHSLLLSPLSPSSSNHAAAAAARPHRLPLASYVASRVSRLPSDEDGHLSPEGLSWWPTHYIDLDATTHPLWRARKDGGAAEGVVGLLMHLYTDTTGTVAAASASTADGNANDLRLAHIAMRERFENKLAVTETLCALLRTEREWEVTRAYEHTRDAAINANIALARERARRAMLLEAAAEWASGKDMDKRLSPGPAALDVTPALAQWLHTRSNTVGASAIRFMDEIIGERGSSGLTGSVAATACECGCTCFGCGCGVDTEDYHAVRLPSPLRDLHVVPPAPVCICALATHSLALRRLASASFRALSYSSLSRYAVDMVVADLHNEQLDKAAQDGTLGLTISTEDTAADSPAGLRVDCLGVGKLIPRQREVSFPLFDRFVHLLCEDVHAALDEVLKLLSKIKQLQQQQQAGSSGAYTSARDALSSASASTAAAASSVASPAAADGASEERGPRAPNVEEADEDELMQRVASYAHLGSSFLALLHSLVMAVPQALLRPEFAPRIAVLVGTYLDHLANPAKVSALNIKNRQSTGFSPRKLLFLLVSMLAKLSAVPSVSPSILTRYNTHLAYPLLSPHTLLLLLKDQYPAPPSLGGLAFLRALGQPDACYSAPVLSQASSILAKSSDLSSLSTSETALLRNPLQVLVVTVLADARQAVAGEVSAPVFHKGEWSFSIAIPSSSSSFSSSSEAGLRITRCRVTRSGLLIYGTDHDAYTRALSRVQARAALVLQAYLSLPVLGGPGLAGAVGADTSSLTYTHYFHLYSSAHVRSHVHAIPPTARDAYWPLPLPTDAVLCGLLRALRGEAEWDWGAEEGFRWGEHVGVASNTSATTNTSANTIDTDMAASDATAASAASDSVVPGKTDAMHCASVEPALHVDVVFAPAWAGSTSTSTSTSAPASTSLPSPRANISTSAHVDGAFDAHRYSILSYLTTPATAAQLLASSASIYVRPLNPMSVSWLSRLAPLCALARAVEQANETLLDDAPDAFKDQCFYTTLAQPVQLPSTATIEWQSLKRHLMTSPTDPFTRQRVGIDSLVVDLQLAYALALWRAKQVGDPM